MATLRIGRVIKALGSDLREVDFTIDFLIIVAYTKGERGAEVQGGRGGFDNYLFGCTQMRLNPPQFPGFVIAREKSGM